MDTTGYIIQDVFGYLFYWYKNYPLVIRIALISILIVTTIYIGLFIRIIIKEINASRRNRLKVKLKKEIIVKIEEIIYE